jgi:hypothetical protein
MMRPISRSFLTRLLLTTALPLALMTADAAGVRAATVIVPTVAGSLDGANGANGVNPGDPGQPGGPGQPASADAGHLMPNSDPLNSATATGGNGGAGGNGAGSGIGGVGGAGGGATATATTTVISGPAEADAFSNGGRGGAGGAGAAGGVGGNAAATSAAASGGSGIVSSSATAAGGEGGQDRNDGFTPWGTALAVSTARNSSGSVMTTAQLPANVTRFGGAIAETSAGIGTGPPAFLQDITNSNATLTPGGPNIIAGTMGAGAAGPGTYYAEADFDFTTALPNGLYLNLGQGALILATSIWTLRLTSAVTSMTLRSRPSRTPRVSSTIGSISQAAGSSFLTSRTRSTYRPAPVWDFQYTVTVPELSTWAMLLIGFAGLGFAGYQSGREAWRRWPPD